MAKPKNGKYLKIGTKIAELSHELWKIDAYESMRFVQQAADVFHKDVARILEKEKKNKKK